jgi:hypothetical protein
MELANSHAEEILYKCRKCADASLDQTTGVQERLSKFSFYVPLLRVRLSQENKQSLWPQV